MTAAELKSDFKLTTDTPYLTLMGELWGVTIVRIWEKIDRVLMALHCIAPIWMCFCDVTGGVPLQSGWPRSGWPQVGHFDQKIKVNQIASYCAMLYPRCCSLWPCTFLGLHSSAFDSSAGQTRGSHFNFYWGTDTTMWSCVHVLCPCVTKIDFYQQLWNWQVKRLIKQHKKEIKMCLFVFENKFEHVTSNTQFRLAQIRAATSLHIMLQVCHRGKSSHKSSVSLWNDSI